MPQSVSFAALLTRVTTPFPPHHYPYLTRSKQTSKIIFVKYPFNIFLSHCTKIYTYKFIAK